MSKLSESWKVEQAICACAMALAMGAACAQADVSATKYAADGGRFDGDQLTTRTDITGFREVNEKGEVDTKADGNGNAGKSKCAPSGAKIAINREDGNNLYLRFRDVPRVAGTALPTTGCTSANVVNKYTQYTIEKATLLNYDVRRSGVTFGALVVPFKFRLGNSKEFASSSTVAPYIGFKSDLNFGLSFTPILSAGIGMVPIADAANNTTTTKAAFSTAVGLVLTSSKNDSFNAGLLFGKDFLNKADRAADPSVSKPWISFYIGYAL